MDELLTQRIAEVNKLGLGQTIYSYMDQLDLFQSNPTIKCFEYLVIFNKIITDKINEIPFEKKGNISLYSTSLQTLVNGIGNCIKSPNGQSQISMYMSPLKTNLEMMLKEVIASGEEVKKENNIIFRPEEFQESIAMKNDKPVEYWVAYTKVSAILLGIVCGILAIIFAIPLFIAFQGFLGIVVSVVLWGASYAFMYYKFFYKPFKRSKCKKCSSIVDPTRDVFIKRLSYQTKNNATYQICDVTCTCPKCGEKWTEQMKGLISSTDDKGRRTETPLEEAIYTQFIAFKPEKQPIFDKILGKISDKLATKFMNKPKKESTKKQVETNNNTDEMKNETLESTNSVSSEEQKISEVTFPVDDTSDKLNQQEETKAYNSDSSSQSNKTNVSLNQQEKSNDKREKSLKESWNDLNKIVKIAIIVIAALILLNIIISIASEIEYYWLLPEEDFYGTYKLTNGEISSYVEISENSASIYTQPSEPTEDLFNVAYRYYDDLSDYFYLSDYYYDDLSEYFGLFSGEAIVIWVDADKTDGYLFFIVNETTLMDTSGNYYTKVE